MAWCYLVTRSYPILCNPMDCSTPGFLVLHHLLEFTSIELVMPSNHLILHPCFSSCPQSSPASGSFPTSHWQLIIKVQSLQGPRNILGDDFQMTSDSLWQDSWFYPRTNMCLRGHICPQWVSFFMTLHWHLASQPSGASTLLSRDFVQEIPTPVLDPL